MTRLYSYDISSAYPFHASQLIDLRDCTFRQTYDIKSAYYGFLIGDFHVDPNSQYAYCSPFITDRGDGTPVNFTGTAHDYPCLLEEVRTLFRYNMGSFDFKSGWFAYPSNGVRPRRPFKELMDTLFLERELPYGISNTNTYRAKGELKSYLLKRVMNGIIGMMLQTFKDKDGNITEYGKLYNPIYHSICTTRTRLQVFEFIVQNEISREELVLVGVDGIKATKHIQLPQRAPMGKWRCQGEEQAVVLSPGGIITNDRNFKKTGFTEFVVECLEHPQASKLGVDEKDPVDLKKLWVNQNRQYPELPERAGDLMERTYLSEPVEI